MDDRVALMREASLFILLGMEGCDEDVTVARKCLREFPGFSELTDDYGSAADALVKLIKDITP